MSDRSNDLRGYPATVSPDLSSASATVDLLLAAAGLLRSDPHRRGCCVHLPAEGYLLATGDLHDNPIHLAKVMRLARVREAPANHVVLHELIHGEHLINGLDFSHRMLARVAGLVVDHPGQVHPVLANHELAQLTGKGVSKGAGDSVRLFNEGLEYVYGGDAADVADAIAECIRAMPLAVRSESGVFCAHSLPRTINSFDSTILDRDLDDADYAGPGGGAYQMTWGRGYSAETIEQLAAAWSVRLFCLGHEHVESGCEVRGDSVVILNSDHERGMTLPIDLASPPTTDEIMYHVIPLASVPSDPA